MNVLAGWWKGFGRWWRNEPGLERERKRWTARCRTAEARVRYLEEYVRDWDRQRAQDVGLPALTPQEMERLAVLAKECGDLMRAVGNVLISGWDEIALGGERSNGAALEKELGHMRAAVTLMLDAGDVQLSEVQSWQRSKRAALAKWTHHQVDSSAREQRVTARRAIVAERRP